MIAEEMEQNVQEIWALFRETDRKFNELRELFTSQWGKLIEALIAPGALKQFQEKGIPVVDTAQRVKTKRNGEAMEIDILATNTDSVVVLEVKTTLKVGDVNEFLEERLSRFLEFFPRYRGMKVYGAVAGVNIVEQANRYAYKNGLFVLTLSGEGTVAILNDEKFIPKDFSQ